MNSNTPQNFFQKYLVAIAIGCTLLYFGYYAFPIHDHAGDPRIHDFAQFPAQDGGRIKPLDTFARTSLMIITHRQTYEDEDTGTSYPATKWMLDVMTGGGESQKVFRIENDDLIRKLKLDRRKSRRYALAELQPHMDYLTKEAFRVSEMAAKDRSLIEAKLLELAQHIQVWINIATLKAPLVVPGEDGNPWQPFPVALKQMVQEIQANGKVANEQGGEAVKAYFELLRSYGEQGGTKTFNEKVAEHLSRLEKDSPSMTRALNLELFFNEFSPFYHCMILYVFIAIAGCLSWIFPDSSKPIRHAAFASMAIVFVVHTGALLTRMYLQGRPPVTNLYSSAVFIGWGCVLACLVLEYLYRNAIAIVVGSVTGACTLIIAHWLSSSGDTLEMMQAVLDTNFWLATHVTCITLGYTAAFVAGFMGVAYIVLGAFTNKLRGSVATDLNRMTYAVLCGGMFLSFVGTVLGGIWADQSWGRFWGWDPKENGALLIVIWIALILHARWGGMVKARGIAVLSVLGIIITSWSWFGTNFLSFGLHSYGHREGAMQTLLLIDSGFLAIALFGALLPTEKWRSFSPLPVVPPTPLVNGSVVIRPA